MQFTDEQLRAVATLALRSMDRFNDCDSCGRDQEKDECAFVFRRDRSGKPYGGCTRWVEHEGASVAREILK